MKKVLKGWLIDNSVTTDNKTDKILLLASAGSLTLDDVLEEMYKQDTGLRPETFACCKPNTTSCEDLKLWLIAFKREISVLNELTV